MSKCHGGPLRGWWCWAWSRGMLRPGHCARACGAACARGVTRRCWSQASWAPSSTALSASCQSLSGADRAPFGSEDCYISASPYATVLPIMDGSSRVSPYKNDQTCLPGAVLLVSKRFFKHIVLPEGHMKLPAVVRHPALPL